MPAFNQFLFIYFFIIFYLIFPPLFFQRLQSSQSQSQQEQQMQLFPGATMAIGPTPTAFSASSINPAQYPSLIGGINSSSSTGSPPLSLTAQSFLLSEAFNAAMATMATIQQQQQQPSQTMEVTQAILAEMAAIAQQQQRQQEAAQMEEGNKLRQSNLAISENGKKSTKGTMGIGHYMDC
jgi:hypothetical protein